MIIISCQRLEFSWPLDEQQMSFMNLSSFPKGREREQGRGTDELEKKTITSLLKVMTIK